MQVSQAFKTTVVESASALSDDEDDEVRKNVAVLLLQQLLMLLLILWFYTFQVKILSILSFQFELSKAHIYHRLNMCCKWKCVLGIVSTNMNLEKTMVGPFGLSQQHLFACYWGSCCTNIVQVRNYKKSIPLTRREERLPNAPNALWPPPGVGSTCCLLSIHDIRLAMGLGALCWAQRTLKKSNETQGKGEAKMIEQKESGPPLEEGFIIHWVHQAPPPLRALYARADIQMIQKGSACLRRVSFVRRNRVWQILPHWYLWLSVLLEIYEILLVTCGE